MTIEGVTYKINQDTHDAEVIKVAATGGQVSILDHVTTDYQDYPVTKIGNRAAINQDLMVIPNEVRIWYNTNLTHFTVPKTVSVIDEATFTASGLQDITFVEGSILHTIDERAFAYVPMTSVKFSANLLLIGSSAFAAMDFRRLSLIRICF